MGSPSTVLRWLGIAISAVVVLAAIAVAVVPRTDWAHDRLRRLVLDAVGDQVRGSVRIGEVSGNLLDAATVENVAIEDSTGAPVFTADRLHLDYALAPLLQRRIVLDELRLVRPHLTLDQSSEGEWNLSGLLPAEPTPTRDTTAAPGFGSWIRIEAAYIEAGRVVVRTPRPLPTTGNGNPAPGRTRVREVDGAPHVVREVQGLDVSLSALVLAHPEEPLSGRLDAMEATALPFEPPALQIRGLEGRITLDRDSLGLDDLRLELPGSRFTAQGRMAMETGRAHARIEAAPFSLSDLSWLEPDWPDEGSVVARLDVERSEDRIRIAASGVQAETGETRLSGAAVVSVGDRLRLGPTDLRFAGLDAGLASRWGGPDLPVEGELSGEFELSPVDGSLDSAVRADAVVRYAPPTGGPVFLRVSGGADVASRTAQDLSLTVDSLRMAVLEAFTEPLPVAGQLGGRVVMNGPLAEGVEAEIALEHSAATGPTRVEGTAFVAPTEEDPAIRGDLRFPLVSLATLGAFVPQAELEGTARGTASLEGRLSELELDMDLTMGDGGSLEAAGAVAFDEATRYEVRATLQSVDAAAVSGVAPRTELSGTLSLEGSGGDSAESPMRLGAEIEGTVDSVGPVGAGIDAAIGEGRIRLDRGELRAASATAGLSGDFGLESGQRGRLDFQVAVDSLSDFAELVSGDTVTRQAGAGTTAPTSEPLAGGLRIEGDLRGNLETMDLSVAGTFEDLRAMGARAEAGAFDLTGVDLRSARPELVGEFGMEAVSTRGFDFDSIGGIASYSGSSDEGEGSASITVVQDSNRDYRVRGGYTAELDSSEVRLDSLVLRMDTVRWESTHASRIGWGAPGLVVDSLHLSSTVGGRVVVDGRLAEGGTSEAGTESRLVTEVADLPIAHVLGILQDSVDASGRVSLRLEAREAYPETHFHGVLSVAEPEYQGTPLPALLARIDYEPADLSTELRLVGAEGMGMAPGDTLLVADGSVELDLFGARDQVASRSVSARVRVDSLPLEGLPRFTDAVSDVRGRLRADVELEGTLDAIEPDGRIDLDLGRLDVDGAGLELRDIVGSIAVRGDSIRLDSLRARSGGGTMRASGRADVAEVARPEVALQLVAQNAQVLDNEVGRDVRADAAVRIEGPFDGLSVEGEVRVREGILFVPQTRGDVVDLQSSLARAALDDAGVSPEVIPEPSPVLDGLRMNVELVATRNTWVRAPDGTAEIYTPESGAPFVVRYDGPDDGIVLEGVVNVDRGEYTFLGRRFELTSGTATFLPSPVIDPLLQLTAAHEVPRPGREALTIQINVGGRLFEPQVVLTSDATPTLSQTDLISYLVLGTPSGALAQGGGSGLTGGSELGALASQQIASMAIGALVEEAYANVEADAMRAGVDVFRVAPAELPEELALEGYFQNLLRGTRLEVGTYVTPRLFVGASGRTTTESWPGFTAEYRTSSGLRWSSLWEPRFLPSAPRFDPDQIATQTRVLGLFLFWERRGRSGTQPGGLGAGPRP